jgi:hypothetical protein
MDDDDDDSQVHDLSALYLKLIEEEAAAAGGSTREWPDKPATWGLEAYYFCSNGVHRLASIPGTRTVEVQAWSMKLKVGHS